MNKLVAVTGGSGYIAGFVIAEFLRSGYSVRASLRNLSKAEKIKSELSQLVDNHHLNRLSFFTADLSSPAGWEEAFTGVDGIIHVASPLGSGKESASTLTKIAKDGTLTVLNAAKNAGVRRIVMPSSGAACTPHTSVGDITIDETFWSDEENPQLDPYRISKLRSEKAAWDYAKENGLSLTTILPGAVFGRVLSADNISSNEILLRLLTGKIPRAMHVPFEISNTTDLAVLHRLAFENDIAIGERFLASSQVITMPEVCDFYHTQFPQTKVPTGIMPNFIVRPLSLFVPQLRSLVPMLSRSYRHTTDKATFLLGWVQHTPEETLLETYDAFNKLGMLN